MNGLPSSSLKRGIKRKESGVYIIVGKEGEKITPIRLRVIFTSGGRARSRNHCCRIRREN